MAWGGKGSGGAGGRTTGEDFAERIASGACESLFVMPMRRFGARDAELVGAALASAPPSFKELGAGGHDIGTEGAAAIGAGLAGSRSLRSLSIGHRGMGDAGVAALSEGLMQNTGLTRLDLELKGAGAAGAAALAGVLERHPTLEALVVARNSLGDAGIASLAAAAAKNPAAALTELDARACGFGSAGLGALAAALASCALKKLNVSDNALGPADAAGGAGAAAAGGAGAAAAGGTAATGDAASALAEFGRAVGACKTLEAVEATGCGLNGEFAVALAETLGSNESLVRLRFDGNPAVAGAGIAALSPSLAVSAVRHLALQNCSIGDEGAHTLASALNAAGNTRLEILDLTGCGLALADGTAEALASVHGLQSLRLFNNPLIGDDGSAALFTAWSKATDTAAAAAVAPPPPPKACAQCGALKAGDGTGKLLRCSKCKAVYYCGAEHQRSHWRSHKYVCSKDLKAATEAAALPPMAPVTAVSHVDLGACGISDAGMMLLCGIAQPMVHRGALRLRTLELFGNSFASEEEDAGTARAAAAALRELGVDVAVNKPLSDDTPLPAELATGS